MSTYIPIEREQLYRDFGLEELLEDVDFSNSPGKPRVLSERQDSFGNLVRLRWIPEDNSVHLNYVAAAVDVVVPGERAKEAYEDHLPIVASEIGWEAIHGFIAPAA